MLIECGDLIEKPSGISEALHSIITAIFGRKVGRVVIIPEDRDVFLSRP